jgi:hypothetical protein
VGTPPPLSERIYRKVQKSGHTGHTRLQSCINAEGGHVEYLKVKEYLCVFVNIFVMANMKVID